jgi:E3 ubiquitin-protein ligase TRIP12
MGGDEEPVTIHNVELYVDLLTNFILNKGIERQVEAMQRGFNSVFSMEKMSVFTPDEVQMLSLLARPSLPVHCVPR